MSLIEELKRRKVFRVAAGYAIIAWVIIQIGEATFEALRLPDWALTITVVFLLIGFPVVVILAWIFDRTPEGLKKTEPINGSSPQITQIGMISLIVVLVIALLYQNFSSLQSDVMDDNKIQVNDKSVAVLPFENYSTAEEDQYFSDGVTEDIIANLAKISNLNVISRTSVMQYKGTTLNLKEIAKELGVAFILEGSIRKMGERVRIVGQLIDTDTDKHIWAETYDRELADIFEIQSDVAKKIADALKAELSDNEKKMIDSRKTARRKNGITTA